MINQLFEQFTATLPKNTTALVPKRSQSQRLIQRSFNRPVPTLFLQCRGRSEISFPDEVIVLDPGSMLIVPPSLSHSERILPPEHDFSNIVIIQYNDTVHIHCASFLNYPSPVIADGIILETTDFPLSRELNRIITEREASESGLSATGRHSVLPTLLMNLYRTLLQEFPEPNYGNEKTNECVRLVEANLSDPNLSVQQLALSLDMHQDYLSFIFHQKTGITLKSFINQKRMKLAQFLVTQSEMRSEEIAWICGFRSASYFNRLFRNTFHISPLTMRTQNPLPWKQRTPHHAVLSCPSRISSMVLR